MGCHSSSGCHDYWANLNTLCLICGLIPFLLCAAKKMLTKQDHQTLKKKLKHEINQCLKPT